MLNECGLARSGALGMMRPVMHFVRAAGLTIMLGVLGGCRREASVRTALPPPAVTVAKPVSRMVAEWDE